MHDAGVRCLEFGGHVIALEWADAAAGAWVSLLTDAHPSAPASLPTKVFRLHTGTSGPQLTVFSDHACIYRGDVPADGLHSLMEAMMNHWVRASCGGLMLHAGLVSREGRGLMLPGPSGSGKSSLIAWLTQRGWAYHGDELVFVSSDGSAWQGFARPLCLKGDWRSLFPQRDLAVEALQGATDRCMVPASAFSRLRGAGPESALPWRIVFPTHTPGQTAELRRVSAGQSAIRLVQAVLNGGNLPQRGMSVIGGMARSIEVFDLRYGGFGDLDASIEALARGDEVCTS